MNKDLVNVNQNMVVSKTRAFFDLTDKLLNKKSITDYNLVYQDFIKDLYVRDELTGHIVEKNFIYKNFEEDTLYIESYAMGEERFFIYKHFSFIKSRIQEFFGVHVNLEFIKKVNSSETKDNYE